MVNPKRRGSLEIVVVDVDRRPVISAKISGVDARPAHAGPGRFVATDVPVSRVEIVVEADGMVTDHRWVDVVPGRNQVDVVLAEPGLPSFKRRGGRVPFRSPDDRLGVATPGPVGQSELGKWAAQHTLEIEHPYGATLAIVHVEPEDLVRHSAAIRGLSGIRHVGRLVNPGPGGTGMLTDRVVVQSVPDAPDETVRAAVNAVGADLLRSLVLKDRWVVTVREPDGFGVLEAAERLEQQESIVSAEPDVAFTPDPDAINPTDQLYAAQWHLPRVGAADAWQRLREANPPGVNPGDAADLTFGAADLVIGVMDTGVESVTDAAGAVTAAHPEFQGTVTDGQSKVVQFFDFGAMVANNDDPQAVFSDGFHGTSCAGVAAAKAENTSVVPGELEGGSGAAPNCRILAAQGAKPMAETEYSDMYLWMAGIDPGNPDPAFPAQLAHGADVITNSWGGYNPATWPISALMDATFTQIADDGRGGLGTLMFFSTGNGSSDDFWTRRPFAAHPRTFGIGAVTDGDVKAGYSNWGDGVDLCAPSSGGTADITTTTLLGDGSLAGHTGGGLDYVDDFGGTSSATPLAGGVAALLLSMDVTLTQTEARTVLIRTAERVDYFNTDTDGHWRDDDGDGVNEYSWWYGFGMVDADRAVCVARNTISIDPSVAFIDVPEGELAIMPVTIRVHGWRPRTFTVTGGPNTTTGPAGSFVLHLGPTATWPGSFNCADEHRYIWLRYTGTSDGDVALGDVTITCNETGEQFVVSLSANTVARVKTALVLSLDRSGSMNDPAGDGRLKIELVRDSSAVVPLLADDSTGLGAVRWDTDADLAGAMSVTDAGPQIGGLGRLSLASFVANHATNVFGLTAIGDAVEAAQTLLDGSAGYDSQAMVVLTDGNETASKFLSDLTPGQLHSHVYAIGVGTAENIQPASLATLTGQQSGYMLMTGAMDADDWFLLTKYFQQILAGVTNTEIVVDPQGILAPGATLRLPFPVNETDREIDVILHSPAPFLVDFRVEAPDGQVFGPALATGPGAQFVPGSGTAYYRLALPTPIVGPQDPLRDWYALLELDRGRWLEWIKKHAEQSGAGSAVHGLRYAFTTQARSSLRMEVTLTQSGREPGATAWLRTSLTEYGFPLEAPADVVAVIGRPDGSVFNLPLTRNPGASFETSFIVSASGVWRITIRATGQTSFGAPFARETMRSVVTWPGGNRPGPTSPPRDHVGNLLACLCRGEVLDPRQAKEWGLDLDALCKCMHRHDQA
jgi:subtilisin family serine protease